VSRRLPDDVLRLPERVRLAAALEALPDQDRLVLAMRLLEGLSALEAAGALRCPAREVEQRYQAALLTLARELGARVASRRAA